MASSKSPRLSRGIYDNRDVATTLAINKYARDKLEYIYEKISLVIKEAYPLVMRPVASGLAEFFKGSDGHYKLYRPFVDLLMIPGNAAITLADSTFPLDADGGIGVPGVPPLARAVQFTQMTLGYASEPQNIRNQNFLSAAASGTFAACTGLLAMELMHAYMTGKKYAYDPSAVVLDLISANTTLTCKVVVGVVAYIAATNAYIKGKEVCQHEFTEWWRELWANIQNDNLMRHLKKLEKMNPEVAVAVTAEYHRAVLAGKDWNYVDFSGRLFETLLCQMPARLVKVPVNTAERMTLPKAWLLKNGYAQSGANNLALGSEYIAEYIPVSVKNSAKYLVKLLGWDDTRIAVKPNEYKNYDQMMRCRMNEFSITSLRIQSVWGLFKQTHQQIREQTLSAELIQRYQQDVINHKLGVALSEPVLPITNPIQPQKSDWSEAAQKNPDILKMLAGEFPEPNATLAQKAELYNRALYQYFIGEEYQPEAANLLIANNTRR